MGGWRRFGPAFALGAALAAAQPAAAQSAGDAHRGAILAQSWCAGCHVIDSKGGGRGADMAPAFPAVAADRSKTPDMLRQWMTREHTRMPDFNLGRREIDDLVAYIRSLAVQ